MLYFTINQLLIVMTYLRERKITVKPHGIWGIEGIFLSLKSIVQLYFYGK